MLTKNPISRLHACSKGLADRSLNHIAFFDRVSAASLTEMGQRCRWIDLAENDGLVSAGEYLDKVFFLLRGELRFSLYTRVGKIVALRGAYPGAYIGQASIAGDVQIPYAVEAARPSTVASLHARTFFEFVERDRDLLHALLRNLVERQNQLAEQVVELSTLTVAARIHNELLRLCRDGMQPDGSAVVCPIPTHSDLARRIGTQREAVSRELSNLQNLGLVVRNDENLFIPDVTRLTELQPEMQD